MKETFRESAKPDFISSLVLIIISLLIIGISIAMPKYVEWGLYATPSLAPTIFGGLLLLSSLILFARSIRAKGYRIRINPGQVKALVKSRVFINFCATLGFVLLFYLLMGRIHFLACSALYLFLNMFYFRSVTWWKNLIISVVTAGVIWYCFNYLFLIPLP